MQKKNRHQRVYKAYEPQKPESPLLFDSPHSGRDYPQDFNYVCGFESLRRAEDIYVDRLFDWLPRQGFSFLKALFPRSYIDLNRSAQKLDRKLFIARSSAKVKFVDEAMGTGLIRRYVTPITKEEIYSKKLRLKDVFNRLSGYYHPYHVKLSKMLDTVYQQHNGYVYLSCHSMPSDLGQGRENPYDIILGTNNNRRCDPALIGYLKKQFEKRGYRVGLNVPYFSGGYMVQKFGAPEDNKHAILLEINRKLYVNEGSLQLKSDFVKIQSDLQGIMRDFDTFARSFVVAKAVKLKAQPRANNSSSLRTPRRT